MNPGHETLATSWREQAARCVRRARSSDSLRDIVRLIAMASTLEHAARKLCSATDVNLQDITRVLNPATALGTHCGPEAVQVRSTDSCAEDAGSKSDGCTFPEPGHPTTGASWTAFIDSVISLQGKATRTRDGIVRTRVSTIRPAKR